MNELKNISTEILEILEKRRQELGLTFEEDNHIYTMNGRTDYPSVSKVLKTFYTEFPTEQAAYNKAGGDPQKQQELLEEWKLAGTYSTNMGSRVHYELERETVKRNGSYKDVRQPIFECDSSQIVKGDNMITAGKDFLNLMEQRGAVLLDTEIVLGDPDLYYVGQPDTMWLIHNVDKTDVGLVVTDYKTNKPKNFVETNYTKRMLEPYQKLPDTALGHYFVQLPLYGKLLIKMLQGTKYENIKLYGCIVVHLKEDATFDEYRVPKEVIKTTLDMETSKYLKK